MFMDLYKDCPHEMMSLMWHIIKAGRALATMRDVGWHHVATDASNEGGDDDDQGDDYDHDDSGSTTPSDHGC